MDRDGDARVRTVADGEDFATLFDEVEDEDDEDEEGGEDEEDSPPVEETEEEVEAWLKQHQAEVKAKVDAEIAAEDAALLAEVAEEEAEALAADDGHHGWPLGDEPLPMLSEEDTKEMGELPPGSVSVKELAAQLGTDPKKLRKWLRKSGLKRPFASRWGWAQDDVQLARIKRDFKED